MIVDKGNKGTVRSAQPPPPPSHLTITHLTSRRGAGAATPLHSSAARAGVLQLPLPLVLTLAKL